MDAGSQAVEQTGQTMQQAVDAIHRVAETIAQITNASQEQSSGLGQINNAIVHMDQLTQQNAALVEQSAAAAESLKEQATRLADLVYTFKLSKQEQERAAPALRLAA